MAQRKASSPPAGAPKPGLAKVRKPPILQQRTVRQVSVSAGRLMSLLDSANVMSEGEKRADESGESYFGTISLLFPTQDAHASLSQDDAEDLRLAVLHDPFARLSVLRIAHREAISRAGEPLDSIHADMHVELSPRGVLVTVDVSAKILRHRLVTGLGR